MLGGLSLRRRYCSLKWPESSRVGLELQRWAFAPLGLSRGYLFRGSCPSTLGWRNSARGWPLRLYFAERMPSTWALAKRLAIPLVTWDLEQRQSGAVNAVVLSPPEALAR